MQPRNASVLIRRRYVIHRDRLKTSYLYFFSAEFDKQLKDSIENDGSMF